MANITDVFEAQKAIESSLTQSMCDFEAQLSKTTRTDNLEQLTKEFSVFRTYVQGIFSLLRQQISALSHHLDNLEMRHRKKYLVLNGVAEKQNEDVSTLVADLLHQNLKLVSISSSQIRTAHRLGNSSAGQIRPILFRLVSPELRIEVWRSKAKLKGTPFVLSEYLTKQRKALFLEARRLFKIRNVWTFDGNITVKLPCGSRQKVFCSEDLDKLVQLYCKPNEESASTRHLISEGQSLKSTKTEQVRSKRIPKNK